MSTAKTTLQAIEKPAPQHATGLNPEDPNLTVFECAAALEVLLSAIRTSGDLRNNNTNRKPKFGDAWHGDATVSIEPRYCLQWDSPNIQREILSPGQSGIHALRIDSSGNGCPWECEIKPHYNDGYKEEPWLEKARTDFNAIMAPEGREFQDNTDGKKGTHTYYPSLASIARGINQFAASVPDIILPGQETAQPAISAMMVEANKIRLREEGIREQRKRDKGWVESTARKTGTPSMITL